MNTQILEATQPSTLKPFYVTWKKSHAARWFSREERCQLYHSLLCRFGKRYGIVMQGYALDAGEARLSGFCDGMKTLQLYLRTVNSTFVKLSRKNDRTENLEELFPQPQVYLADAQAELWEQVGASWIQHENSLPNDVKWNSFHHYAYARPDDLLREPFWYLSLDHTLELRAARYVRLVQQVLDDASKGFWHRFLGQNRFAFFGNPEWLHFRLTQINRKQEENRQRRMEQLLCLGV